MKAFKKGDQPKAATRPESGPLRRNSVSGDGVRHAGGVKISAVCDMIGVSPNSPRTPVMILLAYAVWCVGRMIDALRAGDAKAATSAAAYAFRSLDLAHEFRQGRPHGCVPRLQAAISLSTRARTVKRGFSAIPSAQPHGLARHLHADCVPMQTTVRLAGPTNASRYLLSLPRRIAANPQFSIGRLRAASSSA